MLSHDRRKRRRGPRPIVVVLRDERRAPAKPGQPRKQAPRPGLRGDWPPVASDVATWLLHVLRGTYLSTEASAPTGFAGTASELRQRLADDECDEEINRAIARLLSAEMIGQGLATLASWPEVQGRIRYRRTKRERLWLIGNVEGGS